MTDNLAIWNDLSKTDPAHTKQFSRAGGFKGTSLKPIWIIKMMTARFGPAGIGWGVNHPEFQVVPGDGETLVYCTVSAWHTTRDNVIWGVGGDKVTAKRSSGSFNDDEAFKKAFTDALNNALKSIGVGGDIHMGQFEDDKYLAQMAAEFAPEPPESVTAFIKEMEAAAAKGGEALAAYWIANIKAVDKSHHPYLTVRKDELKQKAAA